MASPDFSFHVCLFCFCFVLLRLFVFSFCIFFGLFFVCIALYFPCHCIYYFMKYTFTLNFKKKKKKKKTYVKPPYTMQLVASNLLCATCCMFLLHAQHCNNVACNISSNSGCQSDSTLARYCVSTTPQNVR